MKKLPPLELLRELLHYDPETGLMTWIKGRQGVREGSPAGSMPNREGYRKLRFKDGTYVLHRVAFFMGSGVEPVGIVDHINGNPTDNRLCNLREATPEQSSCNTRITSRNKSGVKGVYWHLDKKRWVVVVGFRRKKVQADRFRTVEEARIAVMEARSRLHGEFAHH